MATRRSDWSGSPLATASRRARSPPTMNACSTAFFTLGSEEAW